MIQEEKDKKDTLKKKKITVNSKHIWIKDEATEKTRREKNST